MEQPSTSCEVEYTLIGLESSQAPNCWKRIKLAHSMAKDMADPLPELNLTAFTTLMLVISLSTF